MKPRSLPDFATAANMVLNVSCGQELSYTRWRNIASVKRVEPMHSRSPQATVVLDMVDRSQKKKRVLSEDLTGVACDFSFASQSLRSIFGSAPTNKQMTDICTAGIYGPVHDPYYRLLRFLGGCSTDSTRALSTSAHL